MKPKISYRSYIISPAWQQVRREYLHSVGWVCERCHNDWATQAHHLTYDNLGHEGPQDLMALCRQCHEDVHHLPLFANDNQQLDLPFANDNPVEPSRVPRRAKA